MQDEQTMKEKRDQQPQPERQLLLPKSEDSTETVSFTLFLHRMCRFMLPSGRISPPMIQGYRIITYQDEKGEWHQDKTRYLIDINNIQWNNRGERP